MKKSFIIILTLVSSLNLFAQNRLSINGGIGAAKIDFFSRQEKDLKLNGYMAELGIMYHIKNFGIGLNVPIYNYSKIENPDNFELVYNGDISRVLYGNEFYQKNTNSTYFTPTIFLKYDFVFLKKMRLRIAPGYARILGNSSQVIISAPGNYEPTVVSYDKLERKEWAWHYHAALLYDLNNSVSIGFKVNHERVVNYWGFLLYFECNLFGKR